MGLDMTSFDAALKQHYTSDTVENLVYTDNPLLALMPKYEKFGGKNLPIPIIYGTGQGRSATFSTAQDRAENTSTLVTDFVLTPIRDYSLAVIDGMTIAASQGDANAFMEAVTTEIDGAIINLKNTLARDLYRGGYGRIGVLSTGSANVATLATTEDVDNFEVGMQCVFAASEASDALRNSGTALTVSAVDRDAGTVTFSSGLNTETAGDSIFIKGDRQDSATPTRLKVAGLEAWLPTSAPDSTSYFSVDRSSDPVRLGGLRYAPSAGTPIDQILVKAASLVGRQGGQLSHYFMSFATLNDLINTLGSKVHYVDVKANASVGFRAVEVLGPNGTIKCVADRNCPASRIYGLDMKVWKLYSMGKSIRCLDEDKLSMLRQGDADGYEARYGTYAQVGCRAPGRNVVISLST